jgi:hypothetical protein
VNVRNVTTLPPICGKFRNSGSFAVGRTDARYLCQCQRNDSNKPMHGGVGGFLTVGTAASMLQGDRRARAVRTGGPMSNEWPGHRRLWQQREPWQPEPPRPTLVLATPAQQAAAPRRPLAASLKRESTYWLVIFLAVVTATGVGIAALAFFLHGR